VTRSFACVLALAACQHWDYERNAPGHIDVATPPTAPIEEPSDPGEHMIVLSPGGYFGGGASIDDPRGDHGRLTGGALVSIEYGQSPRSHVEDELFGVLPLDSFGLLVGWDAFEDDAQHRTGPMFFDLQYRRVILGGSAGWSYDPSSGAQGPHAMAFLGPFYLGAVFTADHGSTFDLGIMIRGAFAWVWSR